MKPARSGKIYIRLEGQRPNRSQVAAPEDVERHKRMNKLEDDREEAAIGREVWDEPEPPPEG